MSETSKLYLGVDFNQLSLAKKVVKPYHRSWNVINADKILYLKIIDKFKVVFRSIEIDLNLDFK